MYNLLLVDDEPLELETLKDYIPWDTVAVNEIFTAANGREALELTHSHRVDIVITDIKMPIMDGIEFARQLGAESNTAKVIFLSGYDDFDCVHSAYGAGGVDYILKPFVKSEVLRVVQAAEEQLEYDRGAGEAQRVYLEGLLSQLLFRGNSDTAARTLCKAPAFAKGEGVYLINIDTNATHAQFTEALRPLKAYCYGIHSNISTALVLPATSRIDNIISRMRDSLLACDGVYCRFICSRQKIQPEQLSERWALTESYKRYFFYLPETECLDIDTFERYEFSDRIPEALPQLLSSTAGCPPAQLSTLAEQYVAEAIAHNVRPELVVEHAIDIELHIAAQYPAGTQRLSKQQLMDGVLAARDIAAIWKLFSNLLGGLVCKAATADDKNDRLVAEVIERINRDYATDITANSLAEEVYLSPNYLRSIFKEKTGSTIHDCITKCRMKRAVEILNSRQYKIKEIGEMVGYSSESYFCAAFLKYYRTTPNNYKNRSRIEGAQ